MTAIIGKRRHWSSAWDERIRCPPRAPPYVVKLYISDSSTRLRLTPRVSMTKNRFPRNRSRGQPSRWHAARGCRRLLRGDTVMKLVDRLKRAGPRFAAVPRPALAGARSQHYVVEAIEPRLLLSADAAILTATALRLDDEIEPAALVGDLADEPATPVIVWDAAVSADTAPQA